MKYFCCALLASSLLFADTTEVVLSGSMKCTKEELMRFFPEQVVQSILVKRGVPKEKADLIAKELSAKDLELSKLVEEKSEKLEPNPFKNISQREAAAKVYRETLYEVFSKALKPYGITDKDQIQAMLDDLQEARSKLFIECIRKQSVAE